MTKQSFFKIGAHSKKPSQLSPKPSSNSRDQSSDRQTSHNNRPYGNSPRNNSNHSPRKPFNNKTRPINKQSNYQNRKFERSSPNPQSSYRNRSNEPSNRSNFQNKRPNFAKQQRNQVKNEQLKYKKQQPQPLDQTTSNEAPKITNDAPKKQQTKKIKHNRIIVRNLVFDINETHLRKLLSPFGQILDIHIPQNPDKKGSRGFAFVEFSNRNFALKAIKDLNGSTFKGRQIVLDESVSKERYLQSKITQEQNQNHDSLSVKKQEKPQTKIEHSKNNKIKEELSQNSNEPDDQNDDVEDEAEEEEIKPEENEQKSAKNQKGSKKQKTSQEILEDISSEVFIRNLPISVDEKTLHQFFRRYGNLKFAKVVINKETGLSKGSGFLKFQEAAKAKELVEYSRDYEMNLLGKNPNFKQNPGINLQLQGTVLKLFPVESRENIKEKVEGRQEKDRAREQKKKQQEKKKKPIKKVKTLQKLVAYDPNDKRNLKLALLGINKANDEMNERDQERFVNHEREKLQKLKNPNNSVSDRRIILKLLNKDITELNVKNLCNQYLTENQHKLNNLTYCKLMLESLETKKSAGFAFVEFKNHQISSGFLEWVAGEPSKLMKEPFVCEFAIQDSRKMAKLVNRNKKGQNEPKNTNNQSNTSQQKYKTSQHNSKSPQHKSKSPQTKFNRNGSKSNKK